MSCGRPPRPPVRFEDCKIQMCFLPAEQLPRPPARHKSKTFWPGQGPVLSLPLVQGPRAQPSQVPGSAPKGSGAPPRPPPPPRVLERGEPRSHIPECGHLRPPGQGPPQVMSCFGMSVAAEELFGGRKNFLFPSQFLNCDFCFSFLGLFFFFECCTAV